MTETTMKNLGWIDENTPLGRVFEMGSGETLTYNGVNDAGHISIIEADGAAFVSDYTAVNWNDEYSELVEGFADPENALVPTPDDAPPADRKMTPEQEIEFFVRRREIREAKSKFEEQNDYAKMLKKKWESLQEGCDEWLDGIDEANTTALNGFPADSPLGQASEDESNEDESWKDVMLADLKDPDIKPSALKALEENNPRIRTLGELAAWQEKKSDFWIKDIQNFGEAAAENVEDATAGYYARRNSQKTGE